MAHKNVVNQRFRCLWVTLFDYQKKMPKKCQKNAKQTKKYTQHITIKRRYQTKPKITEIPFCEIGVGRNMFKFSMLSDVYVNVGV